MQGASCISRVEMWQHSEWRSSTLRQGNCEIVEEGRLRLLGWVRWGSLVCLSFSLGSESEAVYPSVVDVSKIHCEWEERPC